MSLHSYTMENKKSNPLTEEEKSAIARAKLDITNEFLDGAFNLYDKHSLSPIKGSDKMLIRNKTFSILEGLSQEGNINPLDSFSTAFNSVASFGVVYDPHFNLKNYTKDFQDMYSDLTN